MNRYILIPEDTIRVLPPEDGVEAAVEVFCSRTVIFFDISQIQDVCLMHNVLSNRRRVDALCFTAADRLLEREQIIYNSKGSRYRGSERSCRRKSI